MLQEKKCPKCGTRNYGSEIKYCMSCGYKFRTDDYSEITENEGLEMLKQMFNIKDNNNE